MDGEPLLRGADGHATPVDPGVHRFMWSREAGDIEQELVVREGEHNRVIVLRPPQSATANPVKPPTTTEPTKPGPLPWIVGGAGAALALTGGILWGIGLNDRSTLSSTCASSHSCALSDVESSHTKLVVGDILVGVGVVAIAGAIYLFLRQNHEAPAVTTSAR